MAVRVIPVILIVLSFFYILPSAYAGKLKAGFTPEFMGRQDGDLGLRQKYGLKIHTLVLSDAIMYKAAYEKELDVISGYSTDGRLRAFNLVVLDDDKHIFPPYYCAPIVRQDALKKFPQLQKTLDLLSGHITDSIMTELNYRTDYLHERPEKVAKDFLAAQHLYKPDRNGTGNVVRIGSKIFGEQYILAAMYSMLIKGNTNYRVATKTGLGGTKICFDALTNNEIDFYPEYTGTALLVMLSPPQKIIDSVSHNRDATYNYVKDQFAKKYQLQWLQPIGFNNAYALMMRQKQAISLNIKTISDLKRYLDNSK